jgi:hypothetical protein
MTTQVLEAVAGQDFTVRANRRKIPTGNLIPSVDFIHAKAQQTRSHLFSYPWEYGKAFDYRAIFPILSTRAFAGGKRRQSAAKTDRIAAHGYI